MKFEYEEQKDSTPIPVAFIDTDGDLIIKDNEGVDDGVIVISTSGYGYSPKLIDFEGHFKEHSVKNFYKGDKLTITF
jgi:hypothetical protein